MAGFWDTLFSRGVGQQSNFAPQNLNSFPPLPPHSSLPIPAQSPPFFPYGYNPFGAQQQQYNFDKYAPGRMGGVLNNLDNPASSNIEDRRGEPTNWWLHAVKTATDLTPEQWAKVMQSPLTPFNELFPSTLPPGESQDSQLSKDAGINNIGLNKQRGGAY